MGLDKLSGTGKLERESSILMFNANITSCDENGIVYSNSDPIWVPIGEDNDDLSREKNNDLEAKKNVLGKNYINHTKGAETMEIDPIAIRGNDDLSAILYMIHKYNLVGDKAKLQTMEVTLGDVQAEATQSTSAKYGAFTEDAIIDMKSWGGDTSQLNSPISLNFCGNRVHGIYDLDNNSFSVPSAG